MVNGGWRRCQHRSNYFFLITRTDISRPRVPLKVEKFRYVKGTDRSQFRNDLAQSPLETDPSDYADVLVALYNATLLGLLNEHAPERKKVVPDRTNSAWIDEAVIWRSRLGGARKDRQEKWPSCSHRAIQTGKK